MGDTPSIRQIRSAARILLICPDCGQENSAFAEQLRGMNTYSCRGEDCDYSFVLAGGRADIGNGFVEACKRFYAAFYPVRGQGAR